MKKGFFYLLLFLSLFFMMPSVSVKAEESEEYDLYKGHPYDGGYFGLYNVNNHRFYVGKTVVSSIFRDDLGASIINVPKSESGGGFIISIAERRKGKTLYYIQLQPDPEGNPVYLKTDMNSMQTDKEHWTTSYGMIGVTDQSQATKWDFEFKDDGTTIGCRIRDTGLTAGHYLSERKVDSGHYELAVESLGNVSWDTSFLLYEKKADFEAALSYSYTYKGVKETVPLARNAFWADLPCKLPSGQQVTVCIHPRSSDTRVTVNGKTFDYGQDACVDFTYYSGPNPTTVNYYLESREGVKSEDKKIDFHGQNHYINPQNQELVEYYAFCTDDDCTRGFRLEKRFYCTRHLTEGCDYYHAETYDGQKTQHTWGPWVANSDGTTHTHHCVSVAYSSRLGDHEFQLPCKATETECCDFELQGGCFVCTGCGRRIPVPEGPVNISFDPNGGTGDMTSQQVTANEPFVMPECSFEGEIIPNPNPELGTFVNRKTFAGWAIGSADGPRVQPGETVHLVQDTTVYAIWVINAVEPYFLGTTHPGKDYFIQGEDPSSAEIQAPFSYDGGTISYQWYNNDTEDKDTPIAVREATEKKYILNFDHVGTFYYYCVVTNTIPDNGDGGKKQASVSTGIYRVDVVPEQGIYVSVIGGTGSGYYMPGVTVPVTAEPPVEKVLDYWKINDGPEGILTEIHNPETSFVMPLEKVAIEAVYKDKTYKVDITNGTSEGRYTKGSTVAVKASDAPAGYVFDHWKVLSGKISLQNDRNERTAFLMPGSDVKLEVIYRKLPHVHRGIPVTGQEPSCTEDGWKAYYRCECGKCFEDSACTVLIPDPEAWKQGTGKLDRTGHRFGDYKFNKSMHWKVCERCGKITEREEHCFGEWEIIQDSTSEETGIMRRTCTECGYSEEKNIPRKKRLPDPEIENRDPETDYRLEGSERIIQVPADVLENHPELDTPEKIELQMKTVITEKHQEIPKEQTKVFEVELMISSDGGKKWTPATPENFPKGGLTVTIPYPEGTGMDTHDFIVVHMFTTGNKAGSTEMPEVTKTDRGIEFTISSLSPVSVGWKEIEVKPEEEDTGNGENGTEDKTEPESGEVEETSSATEQHVFIPILIILFVVLIIAGIVILIKKVKGSQKKQ